MDGKSVTQALMKTQSPQREIIVMHLWGEMTFRQIAELMGITPASVNRQFQSGIEILRQMIEPKFVESKQMSEIPFPFEDSDRSINHNAFAEELSWLRPAASRLNRDGVIYQADYAAGKKESRCVVSSHQGNAWSTVALAGFLATCLTAFVTVPLGYWAGEVAGKGEFAPSQSEELANASEIQDAAGRSIDSDFAVQLLWRRASWKRAMKSLPSKRDQNNLQQQRNLNQHEGSSSSN